MSLLVSSLQGPNSGVSGRSGRPRAVRGRNRWSRHPTPLFPFATSRCQEPRQLGADARRGHGIQGGCVQRLAPPASWPATPPPPPRLAPLPAPLTSAPSVPGWGQPGSAPGAAVTPQGPARAPGPRDCASDPRQGGWRGGRAPAASPPPRAGSRRAGEGAEGGRVAEAGLTGTRLWGYAQGARWAWGGLRGAACRESPGAQGGVAEFQGSGEGVGECGRTERAQGCGQCSREPALRRSSFELPPNWELLSICTPPPPAACSPPQGSPGICFALEKSGPLFSSWFVICGRLFSLDVAFYDASRHSLFPTQFLSSLQETTQFLLYVFFLSPPTTQAIFRLDRVFWNKMFRHTVSTTVF